MKKKAQDDLNVYLMAGFLRDAIEIRNRKIAELQEANKKLEVWLKKNRRAIRAAEKAVVKIVKSKK